MSKEEELAPFYAKQRAVKESQRQPATAHHVDASQHSGQYAAERKEEAWWGNRPELSDTASVLKVRPTTRDVGDKANAREKTLIESAKKLEALMLKKMFEDGDQEKLADVFNLIDEDGSGSVNYHEFWRALSPICKNLREQDKQELFMKVDQECSGDMDLYAFLNFFLVTSHDQLQRPSTGKTKTRTKRRGDADTQSLSSIPILATPKTATHKDLMVGIYRHRLSDQIVTISRDGFLYSWTKDLKFQHSFRCNDPKVATPKGQNNTPGLVTGSCYTPVTNLVGVATMKRNIRFFDMSIVEDRNSTVPLAIQLPQQPRAVMSLHVEALERAGNEIFTHGCDAGHVSFQILKPGWHRFEGARDGMVNEKRFYKEYPVVTYHSHNDWVTKAAYVQSVNSIVSAAADNLLSLYDLEALKTKWSLDLSSVKSAHGDACHARGVRTWDWSRQYSMFATGGVERIVQLWSPFVNRPVGYLEDKVGGSSIHKVIFNDADNTLIALEGTAKRVRIWDIRMQRCIGQVQDEASVDSAFMSMFYDNETEKLVSGGCRPQVHMKQGTALVETHDNYVATAVCARKNLIAVANEKNQIQLFRVGSGRHVFSFSACPPEMGAVTCVDFDHEDQRLLVACNNGHIRLFNYGNGQLLKQYLLRGTPDVSGMCSVHEQGETLLYACTENAEVYLWKDTEETTTQKPIPYDRVNASAHELDVSCLLHVPPDSLVTCSFDGKIVVWQRGVLKFTCKDPDWAKRPTMTRGMHKICFLPLQHRYMHEAASSAQRRRNSEREQAENGQKALHVIAAAGIDGNVHFWNLSARLQPVHMFQSRVFPQTKSSFGVVQMCADHTQSFLCCGDAQGLVRVLDISQLASHESLLETGASSSSTSTTLPHVTEFRAHGRALIAMQCVELNDEQVLGSAAIITATLEEIRIWSIEGQQIGQFGSDQWDLSVTDPQAATMTLQGVDTSQLSMDEQEGINDEQDAGMSELLSRLWESDTKQGFPLMNEEIPEEVRQEVEKDPMEVLEASSLRYFNSQQPQPVYQTEIQVGKQPKRMPRDWIRPRKFDPNLFGKVDVKLLADTTWASAAKAGRSTADKGAFLSTRPLSNSNSSLPFSKTKSRIQKCIRDLSATPIEFRPGFIFDPNMVRPSTPEIYGLLASSANTQAKQARSHSSML